MKKIFLLLFLIVCPLARAQGLHGRVLLLQDSAIAAAEDSLKAALEANYNGSVDFEYSLPADLSNYDAILLLAPGGYSPDSLSISDQLRIIDYLKTGGNLYAEAYRGSSADASPFLRLNSSQTDSIDREDTLWHYLGLYNEGYEATFDYYDTIEGVDSEFTKGLRIPQAFSESYEADFYDPLGNIVPVLFGSGEFTDILAWVPLDMSIHAVMHHPVIGNYYGSFLARVLCDYFGLCVDAVNNVPVIQPEPSLRLRYDGTKVFLLTKEIGTIEVMNSLGVIVYRAPVSFGGSQVGIPESLPRGVYFARLQTERGSMLRAIVR